MNRDITLNVKNIIRIMDGSTVNIMKINPVKCAHKNPDNKCDSNDERTFKNNFDRLQNCNL